MAKNRTQTAPRWNPALMRQVGTHDPRVPLAKHEVPQARPPAHVSIIAHQPDDRPHDPNAYRSRSWISCEQITYTERQSLKPVGWVAVVCASAAMDNGGTGHAKRTPIR